MTDVFDEDAKAVVDTILLMRIYDLLLIIARGINEDEAIAVLKQHSNGKIIGPPPSWNMHADEE